MSSSTQEWTKWSPYSDDRRRRICLLICKSTCCVCKALSLLGTHHFILSTPNYHTSTFGGQTKEGWVSALNVLWLPPIQFYNCVYEDPKTTIFLFIGQQCVVKHTRMNKVIPLLRWLAEEDLPPNAKVLVVYAKLYRGVCTYAIYFNYLTKNDRFLNQMKCIRLN